MSKSKPHSSANKARKPDWRKSMGLHPGFPLFPHNRGYWSKKVRTKLFYFGKVSDDPKGVAALDEWNRVKDDLLAGRKPRAKVDGMTVADVCDRFLIEKDRALAAGEITAHTWRDYKRTTDRLVKRWGDSRVVVDLGPDDFSELKADIAKGLGPVATAKAIQCTRVVFKFAYDNGLIPRPVLYGSAFKRPSRKTMRIQRAKQPPKMFTTAEVKALISNAKQPLKAMIYLGINCGLGNNDCATLEYRHVDLEAGWLDCPRIKTGIGRRCPLWPETVKALKESLSVRRTPKDKEHANLFFVTAALGSFHKSTSDNPVSKEFAKLVKSLKMEQRGRNFYGLRHTFRTIADSAKDQPAANAIMGHTDESMAGIYRETIDDDRLVAVTDHVRKWLYPKEATGKGKESNKAKAPARQSATVALRVVG